MAKSIEEQIEDWGKNQLRNTKYFTKTESINPEIENASKTAPSKNWRFWNKLEEYYSE